MSGSIGGGSSGSSIGSSFFNATPTNLQLPDYTGLAPGVASGVSSVFGPNAAQGSDLGSAFGLNPLVAGGSATNSPANPLVAGVTQPQNLLLNQVQGAANNPLLNSAASQIGTILNPNYPASLATSPQTTQAIGGAVQPILNAFKQTTLPQLSGQFTASGQRTGPQGSSAFDNAAVNSQNNVLAQTGAASTGITNAAYQSGLAQQFQAIGQAGALSTTELNNLINSLQASALPQLTQQYGINQGLQLYQQQLQSILTALGLGGQISQPAIAYNQTGGSQSQSQNQSSTGLAGLASGFGALGTGIGNAGSFLLDAGVFGNG